MVHPIQRQSSVCLWNDLPVDMILRRLAFQVQFHNNGNSKAVIATTYFWTRGKIFFFFFSKNPAWTSLQTLLTPCLTESVEGASKCEGQFKPSFKPSKWLRLNGRLDKDWPDDWKYGGWCEETRERETSWWAGETTGNGSGPTGLMQVGEEHKNTEQPAWHHWLTVLHVKNYES